MEPIGRSASFENIEDYVTEEPSEANQDEVAVSSSTPEAGPRLNPGDAATRIQSVVRGANTRQNFSVKTVAPGAVHARVRGNANIHLPR